MKFCDLTTTNKELTAFLYHFNVGDILHCILLSNKPLVDMTITSHLISFQTWHFFNKGNLCLTKHPQLWHWIVNHTFKNTHTKSEKEWTLKSEPYEEILSNSWVGANWHWWRTTGVNESTPYDTSVNQVKKIILEIRSP